MPTRYFNKADFNYKVVQLQMDQSKKKIGKGRA